MQKKTKLRLLITLPIFFVLLVLGYIYYGLFLKYPYLGEDNVWYYESIKKQAFQDRDSIKLDEIFTFKWDTAYAPTNTDEAYAQLKENISFDNADYIGPIDGLNNELEMIFVLDNKVVYEFLYSPEFIRFPLDEIIENGTAFKSNQINKALVLTKSS